MTTSKNAEIAADILKNYGIPIKTNDEFIPFYGMLIEANKKLEGIKTETTVQQIVFEDKKHAFWYGFGKWGLTSCLALMILVGIYIYANAGKQNLPPAFIKNAVMIKTTNKGGINSTGFLLEKGSSENYKVGKNYIVLRPDGSIIVPVE